MMGWPRQKRIRDDMGWSSRWPDGPCFAGALCYFSFGTGPQKTTWMGKPWQRATTFFVSKIHHDRKNNSIIRMLQDMHSFTICLLFVDSLVSLMSSIHLLMRIFIDLLLHWFHSMSCHSIHQSFTASLMHLGRTTPSMRCVFKQFSL